MSQYPLPNNDPQELWAGRESFFRNVTNSCEDIHYSLEAKVVKLGDMESGVQTFTSLNSCGGERRTEEPIHSVYINETNVKY